MIEPRATYRLQLHAGFTFADAAAAVPYFAELGISHLYLSPVLTAAKGSMHGYDVVDPTSICHSRIQTPRAATSRSSAVAMRSSLETSARRTAASWPALCYPPTGTRPGRRAPGSSSGRRSWSTKIRCSMR